MTWITIHLRRQTAIALVDELAHLSGPIADLHREIKRSLASKPAIQNRRRLKTAKRASKREETSEIRRVCVARSGYMCEGGCGRPIHGVTSVMDHFFGRAKVPQRVANCWMICRSCDKAKTNNRPDAAHWLRLFIAHTAKHGYLTENHRAQTRLDSLTILDGA